MGIANKPVQATTREFTGSTSLVANPNRTYFFITFTSGNGTVRFGEEGGEIPLIQGGHYAPPISPSTSIHVTTTGTYVIHTNEWD